MYLDLPEGKIALDEKDKDADLIFISHAHSDHIRGAKSGKRIIASKETEELIKARNNISINLSDESRFTLLNAGHILGSKQIYIESSLGYSILYTGDYQLQESCVAPKIEHKKSDVLIIDSTYPYMNVKFDDREEVEESIKKYVSCKLEKGIVLFNSYSLGKAQELIKIMNEIGILPVVDKTISKVNKVYNSFGANLEYVSIYDNEEEFNSIVKNNFVGIVSTSNFEELARNVGIAYRKRVFTAVATGFAKIFKFNTNVQFALSDHADIYQAVEYINMVEPKVVYTYGPNSRLMSANLSKFGISSTPFSEAKQISIAKNKERL